MAGAGRPRGALVEGFVTLAGVISLVRSWAVLPAPLRFRNAQVPTDLARQGLTDLTMSGYRSALTQLQISPPGMATAFPQQHATMLRQMPEQIAPLHTAIISSS